MTAKPRVAAPDLTAIQSMLLWARKNKIAVSEIQVGATRLALADLGMGDALKKPATEADARRGLYEEMGGAPFKEAMEQSERDSSYEDEEDE